MTLIRREIQNVRLALRDIVRSVRRTRFMRIFVAFTLAAVAFLASVTDFNRLEPPFGGGGSACAVAA